MFLSTCEIMSTIIGALAGSIASSRVKMRDCLRHLGCSGRRNRA